MNVHTLQLCPKARERIGVYFGYLNMAGDKRKKFKESIKLKQVTATSFNPTPRKEQVTRVKAPVSFFTRPKPKIVVPRSFFAPKLHGNAC